MATPVRIKQICQKASESGSVMLEFVIAFPVILVLIFACVQFAHLWVAKMVTHYAAYCAARTALVCHVSEYGDAPGRAAWAVCKLVSVDPDRQDTVQTSVQSDPQWNVQATVTHKFSLIGPIIGPIVAWSMNPWDDRTPWAVSMNAGNTGPSGLPAIILTETVILPKPYVTVVPARF